MTHLIHVLCAVGLLLQGSHGGAVLVNHSGYSPLTLTHLMLENHVDIPWNSVVAPLLRREEREGEVREVFISTPSFVLEVNVNASAT